MNNIRVSVGAGQDFSDVISDNDVKTKRRSPQNPATLPASVELTGSEAVSEKEGSVVSPENSGDKPADRAVFSGSTSSENASSQNRLTALIRRHWLPRRQYSFHNDLIPKSSQSPSGNDSCSQKRSSVQSDPRSNNANHRVRRKIPRADQVSPDSASKASPQKTAPAGKQKPAALSRHDTGRRSIRLRRSHSTVTQLNSPDSNQVNTSVFLTRTATTNTKNNSGGSCSHTTKVEAINEAVIDRMSGKSCFAPENEIPAAPRPSQCTPVLARADKSHHLVNAHDGPSQQISSFSNHFKIVGKLLKRSKTTLDGPVKINSATSENLAMRTKQLHMPGNRDNAIKNNPVPCNDLKTIIHCPVDTSSNVPKSDTSNNTCKLTVSNRDEKKQCDAATTGDTGHNLHCQRPRPQQKPISQKYTVTRVRGACTDAEMSTPIKHSRVISIGSDSGVVGVTVGGGTNATDACEKGCGESGQQCCCCHDLHTGADSVSAVSARANVTSLPDQCLVSGGIVGSEEVVSGARSLLVNTDLSTAVDQSQSGHMECLKPLGDVLLCRLSRTVSQRSDVNHARGRGSAGSSSGVGTGTDTISSSSSASSFLDDNTNLCGSSRLDRSCSTSLHTSSQKDRVLISSSGRSAKSADQSVHLPRQGPLSNLHRLRVVDRSPDEVRMTRTPPLERGRVSALRRRLVRKSKSLHIQQIRRSSTAESLTSTTPLNLPPSVLETPSDQPMSDRSSRLSSAVAMETSSGVTLVRIRQTGTTSSTDWPEWEGGDSTTDSCLLSPPLICWGDLRGPSNPLPLYHHEQQRLSCSVSNVSLLTETSDTALSKNNSHKVVVKQRSDPECKRQTDSEPTSDDKSPAAADSHTLEWCQSQSDQPSSGDAVCLSRSVECLQQQLPEGATDDVTSALKPLHRRQSTPHTLKDVGVFPVDQSRSGQHECDRAADTEEQQNSSDITASPAATSSTSRISNFFSKHSFKGKPLKRTKSVTKLERKRFQTEISEEPMSCSGSAIVSPSVCSSRLRSSRSHESLLSGNSALSDPATAEDEDEPEEQQQQQPPHCDVSSVLGADPGGSASLLEMMASGDVSVEPVHSSLMDGQQFCIQVTHNDRRHSPRLYSCRTASERDRWIQSLRAIVQPNREKTLRVDRSLRVWLLEAKDVSQKKRYYCELYLDDTLYARTSSKAKQELCFWGDQFELNSLPALSTLQVRLYREPERKRRKEKVLFIGHVTIPVSSVTKRFYVEKWYPVVLDKNCTSKFTVPPSIRVKCRYQCVDILPLHCYNQFLNYISTRYRQLCAFLEPTIGVKYKEHIAGALVAIMQRQSLVHHLLADLVLLDVNNVDDHRLTFRGNSLATKATECYMRMVGERYLSETLGEPVRHLLNSGCGDLEVDPLKVAGANALKRQRAALRVAVERMWQAILRSYSSFPRELRACFNTIWQRLQNSDRADMCENVISSCIFLRFFCPAILSPSLFGLVQEYPDEKGVRNLTLVAKALQTLANFSQFSGKENYMEFLNDFITEQSKTMRLFLQKITLNAADNNSSGGGQSGHEWDGVIDLGRHLSLLHSLLSECLSSSGGGSGGGDKTTAPDLLGERKLLQAALDSVRQTPPTSSVTSSQATPSSCVSPSSDCSVSNRNLAGANSTQRLVANTGRRDGQSVYSPIGTASRFGTTSSSTTSSSSASSCSSAGYNNHQRRRQGSVAVAADPSSTTAAASSDHRSRTLPRHVLSSHSATLSQQQQLARSAVDNRQLHLQHDTGGSQMSISQLSTVASSGYQSQGGTSPVDLTASSSQPVRRVQPHADIYSATLHSARGGYRQAMGRPLIPASPSPQQHQRPLVPVNKTNIASDNSDTQFPLRTARHCRTQSKLLTLAGAISMDDVQTGVAPTTSSVRLTRSSSSSLSPPRERRLAVNSRTTPRTAPPPPPTTESGDPSDSSRLARAKNARRASVEVLATRRQHMHTDSDSSGGNSRARTRTRNRRSRHYEKTFEEYEEEIRLLQCQMEQLQSRLDAEIPPGHTRVPGTYPGVRHQKVVTEARTDHSDGGVAVTAPITNILNRLSVVEDELRREQSQLTCALTEKERVIQAQSMRIAELNAANCQLLACLQETVCSPQTVPQTTPAPAHTTVSAVVSDTSDYKSSSC